MQQVLYIRAAGGTGGKRRKRKGGEKTYLLTLPKISYVGFYASILRQTRSGVSGMSILSTPKGANAS
ncbi:MAG: hypothetical protein P8N67_11745, partial [Pseudomonadales bacterium]|nr:hypothetical protein [Pseudomonadales bacterium]